MWQLAVSKQLWPWQKAPLWKIILPFSTGILLSEYATYSSIWLLIPVLLIGLLLRLKLNIKQYQWQSYWLHLCLIIAGWCLHFSNRSVAILHEIEHTIKGAQGAEFTIHDRPIPTKQGWKLKAHHLYIVKNKHKYPLPGECWVYWSNQHKKQPPQKGEQFYTSAPLRSIAGPANPMVFNYRDYAAKQHLIGQINLHPKYKLIALGYQRSRLLQFIDQLQHYVYNCLKRYIQSSTHQALGAALIMGHQHELDKTILQSYANIGVVHVIAISGMHLGLILLLLTQLTKGFRKHGISKWIRFSLVLAGIWLFTLMAGASPALLRASVMFSFLWLAENSQKKQSLWQGLAAAVFFLLLTDTNNLFNLGFQLSITALIGICSVQPLQQSIHQKIATKWYWLTDGLLITLAAQLFTAPIITYHFHQFPTWFLMANLPIIFLSNCILYGLVALLVLSPIAWIAQPIGWCISQCMWIMNQLVYAFNQWPLSQIQPIQFTFFQYCLLWLGLLCFVGFVWFKPHKKMLYISLLAILVFQCLGLWEKHQLSKENELVVWQQNKNTIISFRSGLQTLVLTSTDSAQTTQLIQPYLHRKETSLQIRPLQPGIYQVGQSHFSVLGRLANNTWPTIQGKWAIITANQRPPKTFTQLPKMLILDGSNHQKTATLWQAFATQHQKELFNTAMKGAWVK